MLIAWTSSIILGLTYEIQETSKSQENKNNPKYKHKTKNRSY